MSGTASTHSFPPEGFVYLSCCLCSSHWFEVGSAHLEKIDDQNVGLFAHVASQSNVIKPHPHSHSGAD